jgi:hypothetical protein
MKFSDLNGREKNIGNKDFLYSSIVYCEIKKERKSY